MVANFFMMVVMVWKVDLGSRFSFVRIAVGFAVMLATLALLSFASTIYFVMILVAIMGLGDAAVQLRSVSFFASRFFAFSGPLRASARSLKCM